MCAEVVQLEGLWGKGTKGEQLLEIWGEWVPHCMESRGVTREGRERRGVAREGSETRQLFSQEEEEVASNYLHALIASGAHIC